jgi:hypothetical protein
MDIVHNPTVDPRQPSENTLRVFWNLEPGDQVRFFEWSLEALTIKQWRGGSGVGQYVVAECEGSDWALYKHDGGIWVCADLDPDGDTDDGLFPVENLHIAGDFRS